MEVHDKHSQLAQKDLEINELKMLNNLIEGSKVEAEGLLIAQKNILTR